MRTFKKKRKTKNTSICFLALAIFGMVMIKAADKTPYNALPDPLNLELPDNGPFYELVDKFIKGECFDVNLSSTSVRNNKGYLYSYSSYGKSSMQRQGKSTLISTNVSTAFSDRNNFGGKKDVQGIEINSRGSGIAVVITLKTWNNAELTLSNAKISKERFGYFVTGEHTDGRRTIYYTMSIYKSSCLI